MVSSAKMQKLLDSFRFRKTTGDNGFLLWEQLKNLLIGLQPVKAAGHNHVEDDKVDRSLFYDFKGFFATGCGVNGIPEFAEHISCNIKLFGDIIDYKDGF